jgi:hypothetical protein
VERPIRPNRKINNPEEKYDNLIIYKNVGQQTEKKTQPSRKININQLKNQ